MKNNPLSVATLRLPFSATLVMPGSKSHANRAIIAACLSPGTTTIHNATACDDVHLLVNNLQKMGFDIHYTNRKEGTLVIRGGVPKAHGKKKPVELFCGNAGTTTRFLTALACAVPGSFIVTGDKAMQKRPIRDLVKALKELGADIGDTNGCPPVFVGEKIIHGGRVNLSSQKSSQYVTALLLISPDLSEGLLINISGSLPSKSYIDLTKQVMRDFGVVIRTQKGMLSVSENSRYRAPQSYAIEGDHSAAGTFIVLVELTHSAISFSNLDPYSKQGDAMLKKVISRMRKKGNLTIDCSNMPDQVMNLAVLAAFRDGVTNITGAENLQYKECDRLEVLTSELQKAGVDIQKNPDGVIIRKSTIKNAFLDPHDDHRMAFCFAILGSVYPGIRIKNADCISKSYPNFFADLKRLHFSSRPIVIIGMRGSGKSTFGKSLARALSLKFCDTDQVFEHKHGSIRTFIRKYDWKTFRKEEELIVQESLNVGRIVALGGGAIESIKTRKLLKEKAIVIHLTAKPSELIERLKNSKRPPLTDLPLEQEVPLILKKRTPLYQEAAHFTLHAGSTVDDAIYSLRSLCSL